MNTEERRLSHWLHAQTPQPPRLVSVDDIAARVRRVRPPAYRRWAPVLAAACVVLVAVAIALVVSANSSNPSHPVAPATTSPTTPPSTSSNSPKPSASPTAPAGISVGPWGATTLGGTAAHGIPLAGDRDSLYVNDGTAILRLDAASGAVLARRSYPTGAPAQAMIVADALWTTQAGSGGTVLVRGLDLNTLTPVAAVTVHVPGVNRSTGAAALEVNAKDGRLYVGVNNTVAVIDAASRQIIHEYQNIAGAMADLAVSPDDTRLYVTSPIPNSTDSSLTVLNPDTGAAIVGPIHLGGGTGIEGIAASAGGIWLQTGSGMTAWLDFRPTSELTRPVGPLTTAGGGFATTSTVTTNVVWLGGSTKLACADPARSVPASACRPHTATPPTSRASPSPAITCSPTTWLTPDPANS
jgi:hypothetical protein